MRKLLADRRHAMGATLQNVASLVGVTPSTILRWEQGKIKPHRVMLRAWEVAIFKMEQHRKGKAS